MRLMGRIREALSMPGVIGQGEGAGLKLFARHADPNFVRGTYEPPMQQVVVGCLSPGDTFYDVGANIGFFSLLAARRVGEQGRVYAFEPVPENANAIARSARLNNFDTIEVFSKAVGAANGRCELMLAHHIGGAVLASAGVPPDMRGHVEVSVTTLDDVIAERPLRPPSLVKIDVEGAEIDVLNGMQATLRKHRPAVVYEVDDATREGLERKAGAIAAFMTAADYAQTTLPAAYRTENWHVEHFLARPITN